MMITYNSKSSQSILIGSTTTILFYKNNHNNTKWLLSFFFDCFPLFLSAFETLSSPCLSHFQFIIKSKLSVLSCVHSCLLKLKKPVISLLIILRFNKSTRDKRPRDTLTNQSDKYNYDKSKRILNRERVLLLNLRNSIIT